MSYMYVCVYAIIYMCVKMYVVCVYIYMHNVYIYVYILMLEIGALYGC